MHYVSCSIDLFCFLRTKNQTASLLWQGKPFQGKGQEGTDVKNKISSPFLGRVGEGPAQIAPRWPMTCEWKQPHTLVPTLYRAHSTAAGLRGFQSPKYHQALQRKHLQIPRSEKLISEASDTLLPSLHPSCCCN